MKKKSDKKIIKTNADLLEVIDYFQDEAFITKDRTIIDIYNIECCNLRGLTEDEINDKIYNFYLFLKTYDKDIKLISMKFPTTTITQQNFVKHKIKTCQKAEYMPFLTYQLLILEQIAEDSTDLEFYLMTFSKNSSEYLQSQKDLQRLSNNYFTLHKLDLEKKENILFKLSNQNCKIF